MFLPLSFVSFVDYMGSEYTNGEVSELGNFDRGFRQGGRESAARASGVNRKYGSGEKAGGGQRAASAVRRGPDRRAAEGGG
jgi:hypothetical protein